MFQDGCHGGHLGYWNGTILAIWILKWNDFNDSESPRCPNASLQVLAQSDLAFENRCGEKIFKKAAVDLGYRNGTTLAILNLHFLRCLPPSMGRIRLSFRKPITTEDFEDGNPGGHLGYRSKIILAILNPHNAPMPPTKFLLQPTYHSGADEDFKDDCPGSYFGHRNRTISQS